MAMVTVSRTIETESSTRMTASPSSTRITSFRRSTRSAIAPACKANNNHGSRCKSADNATSRGSCVSEAMSSGPAASANPSPRFDVHDDASSQRKLLPRRRGTKASTTRFTGETMRGLCEGADACEGPADEELLDLAGPLVQRCHARVAQQLAGWVLVDVAVTTMRLHASIRRPHRGFGGEQLRL